MEIKFKTLADEAILPIRANAGDAGIDLTPTRITQEINECGQLILVYHILANMSIENRKKSGYTTIAVYPDF